MSRLSRLLTDRKWMMICLLLSLFVLPLTAQENRVPPQIAAEAVLYLINNHAIGKDIAARGPILVNRTKIPLDPMETDSVGTGGEWGSRFIALLERSGHAVGRGMREEVIRCSPGERIMECRIPGFGGIVSASAPTIQGDTAQVIVRIEHEADLGAGPSIARFDWQVTLIQTESRTWEVVSYVLIRAT